MIVDYFQMLFVQWLFAGAIALVKGAWAFSWAHPAWAGFVFFSLFCMSFMAYGTLRRMWDDGTFAKLHWTQKAAIAAPLIGPFIFAYLFDIFVMRCVYGWVRFGMKPWHQDWRVFSASWTFSRLVWLLKDTNAEAQWWHQILHAIDKEGH